MPAVVQLATAPSRARRRCRRRPSSSRVLLPVAFASLVRGGAAIVGPGAAPPFLSCEGGGFPPLWAQLKLELRRAASGPRRLRDAAAEDERLLLLAGAGFEACAAAAQEFASVWTQAYWAIRSAAVSGGEAPSQDFGLLEPWLGGADRGSRSRDGEPFCLAGCAAAMWVVALASWAEGGGGDAASVMRLAQVLVGVAVPWNIEKPYRWGDAFVPALGAWGGWARPTAAEVCEDLPFHPREVESPHSPLQELGPPGAIALFRRLQPCDPMRESCWRSGGEDWAQQMAHRIGQPGLAERFGGEASRAVAWVTLVGHHAVSVSSTASMFRAAALAQGLDLRLRFAGSFYLCNALQAEDSAGATAPCAPDELKDMMRDWLERGRDMDVEAAGSVAEHADRFRHALAAVEAEGPQASFYACMDLVVFCWLLRRRAAQPVLQPMLLALGMGLLQDVPPAWHDEVAADAAAWAWESATSLDGAGDAREGHSGDVFFTIQPHIVLQMFWQTGVVVPWAETPGLAIWSGASHAPPQSGLPQLLVLRSAFWRLPAGHVLRTLMSWMFSQGVGSGHKVAEVHWMDSFLRGSVEAAAYKSSWVSLEQMAAHTAALYMPSELYQLRFSEMYSMGLPIVAPSAEWAIRILMEMFRMWGQMSKDNLGRPPTCDQGGRRWCVSSPWRSEADSWPFGAPFLDPDADPAGKLAFYSTLIDTQRYPYVLHFDSLAGLHAQLLVAHSSGAGLGELMRRFFRDQVVANSLRFFGRAVSRLLGRPPPTQA